MTPPAGRATPDGLVTDCRHELSGLLDVDVLAEQQIYDRISVESEVLAIVHGGLERYLLERKNGEFDVPRSYSSWDEGFEPMAFGPDTYAVKHGAVGRHEDDRHSLIHLCYESNLVRAAVRISTGGGRYNSEDVEFHAAVPAAVVDGPDATVAIAPRIDNCTSDVPVPRFEYTREGGQITGFHSVDTE